MASYAGNIRTEINQNVIILLQVRPTIDHVGDPVLRHSVEALPAGERLWQCVGWLYVKPMLFGNDLLAADLSFAIICFC